MTEPDLAKVHQPCSLYGPHKPPIVLSTTEEHHDWPKYLGGPEKGHKTWVCGSCHAAVHAALDGLLKGLAFTAIPGTPRQRRLALAGYRAWLDAGRPIADPQAFLAHHPDLSELLAA